MCLLIATAREYNPASRHVSGVVHLNLERCTTGLKVGRRFRCGRRSMRFLLMLQGWFALSIPTICGLDC